jgi:hypothetical protein
MISPRRGEANGQGRAEKPPDAQAAASPSLLAEWFIVAGYFPWSKKSKMLHILDA